MLLLWLHWITAATLATTLVGQGEGRGDAELNIHLWIMLCDHIDYCTAPKVADAR